jgi:sugar lactone lactonase YvrE
LLISASRFSSRFVMPSSHQPTLVDFHSATPSTPAARLNDLPRLAYQFYRPLFAALQRLFQGVNQRCLLSLGLLLITHWGLAQTAGTTVAGGNDNGAGPTQLPSPYGLALDKAGNLYVVDRNNHRVQKFPVGSTANTPGVTVAGGNGAGPAPNQLANPTAIAFDKTGNIYVVDHDYHRIKKFPPNSTSATAGTVVAGGNGQGTSTTQLSFPIWVAIDSLDNLYVADQVNNRVQLFPPNSTSVTAATTVAGGNGEGSSATQLNFPYAIALDGAGNLYVADHNNHRVQKFPAGSRATTPATTVAGGNGRGTNPTQLYGPLGLAIDRINNLYVSDLYNHRVQLFPPNSTSATSATSVAGGRGQGPAADQLAYPSGLTIDGAGNLFVSDFGNSRVQQFSLGGTEPSSLTIISQPLAGSSVCAGGRISVGVSASAVGPITYQWYKDDRGSPVAAQTSATLSLSNVQASDAGSYSVVISSAGRSISSTAFMLTVKALPDASFSGLSSHYCPGDAPVELVPTISWGSFSGPGVADSRFTPANAGRGGAITYSVIANGCFNFSNQTVVVSDDGSCGATAQCNSIQSGDWSSAATWSCGHEPTLNDVVTINVGHTVTISTATAQAQRLTYTGGTLRYAAAGAKVFIKGGD